MRSFSQKNKQLENGKTCPLKQADFLVSCGGQINERYFSIPSRAVGGCPFDPLDFLGLLEVSYQVEESAFSLLWRLLLPQDLVY